MSSEKQAEISKIVQKLTMSGKKTVDDSMMKRLKLICMESDGYLNYAFYTLMTQLRKHHSEVRYSALVIINEFFIQSAAFRKLLERDLNEFFDLVVGTDLDKPLPLPWPRAKDLKQKGLELLKAWSTKFESPRLRNGLNFLKKCKKIDFNDIEARSTAQIARQRLDQERLQRVINEQVNKTKNEILETSGELSNILLQMENCFRLLVPYPTEELFSYDDFKNPDLTVNIDCKQKHKLSSELEEENSKLSEERLRHHGIHDMKKTVVVSLAKNPTVSIEINEDTQPIIENLNDLYKQLSSRYLPLVTKWLKVLTKGSNCTDILKKAIDLKQLIQSGLDKYKELKIDKNKSFSNNESDDESDFVEVKEKEGFEAEAYKGDIMPNFMKDDVKPGPSSILTKNKQASMWQFKSIIENEDNDPTTAASTVNTFLKKHKTELPGSSSASGNQKKKHKSELFDTAPVLPYDVDLYHWEEDKLVLPERMKFDSLHNFWENKNDDDENEILKEAQIASIRTRKIDFSGKFEPVKWSCRTPLPSGKLCPRKDRFKCPFHGKIVKRDSMGNPVEEVIPSSTLAPSCSKAAPPDWQDPSLLRDIEAATGVNLEMPLKKRHSRQKTEGGLTNIKKMKLSAKERIAKKIIKRYKHYAKKLDEMERKRFNDKFGDQWNYY